MPSYLPATRLGLNRVATLALGAALMGLALPSAWAQTTKPVAPTAPGTAHEVLDPYYGDTLFQFFQDHYFTAATELMVSQHFDRVSHHAQEAEVLRGGILLSYGLHREAGAIFERLIQLGASPATQDRAWFFLAKIRYQRGYLVEAQDAINRIGTALAADLQEERNLLQANIFMARDDFASAANLLKTLDTKTPGARFVQFNLGVALIRSGDTATGTAVLDSLGRASSDTEEQRSLRDQANLALGFAALTNQQPLAARNYLERVRLNSLQANKALLGLGWASAALKEPQAALVPWQELAGRGVADSAMLEAQLAVPYAYAELGAYSLAADHYAQAIDTFAKETQALTESIAEIRTGKLLTTLIDSNPAPEMGWFWSLQTLPKVPQAKHLTQVMAQHSFQEALKNYRDLQFLANNLAQWQDKLSVFEDMLNTRREGFAQRLPAVRNRAGAMNAAPLQAQADKLDQTVARAQADEDGAALADAKQLDLLERLDRVQAILATSAASPQVDDQKERARLARGALTWQLVQDAPDRLWQAKKTLASIQTMLDQARSLDSALTRAQRDEPARFESFAKRIAQMAPLLQAQVNQVAALTHEQRVALQDIAIATLARQQERLAEYASQAQFAVAQLYDRSATSGAAPSDTKGEDSRAVKP